MGKDFSKATNDELVEALLADDQGAWTYVYLGVLGTLKHSKKYTERLERKSLQPEDVAGQVFDDLHLNGFAKIRGYRKEAPFKNWLSKVIQTTVDEVIGSRYEQKNVVTQDHTDPCSVIAMSEQREVPQRVRDWMADARSQLVELWRMHPDWYWALVLKKEAGLDSRAIANILNVTAVNVDVMTFKARAALK